MTPAPPCIAIAIGRAPSACIVGISTTANSSEAGIFSETPVTWVRYCLDDLRTFSHDEHYSETTLFADWRASRQQKPRFLLACRTQPLGLARGKRPPRFPPMQHP